ncbi:mariner Mos1 transposase [Trichonephila clavipes]|nr:mariner Mos1 transposase [Trichonephila clavipes]
MDHMVFYRQKIRRASRPGEKFNLVIDEESLYNACHVWSRIILLKYGWGQALKVLHELTAEDKNKRKVTCLVLLRDQRKDNMDRIVNCEEKWVCYSNTSQKGSCLATRKSAGSVARRTLTKKVLLCIL